MLNIYLFICIYLFIFIYLYVFITLLSALIKFNENVKKINSKLITQLYIIKL